MGGFGLLYKTDARTDALSDVPNEQERCPKTLKKTRCTVLVVLEPSLSQHFENSNAKREVYEPEQIIGMHLRCKA